MSEQKDMYGQQVQLAAELSAIAYQHGETSQEILGNMQHALQQEDLPTKGEWEIVWGPCVLQSNLMFIVQRKDSKEYAVVIRGTVHEIMSLLQDIELELVDLPWKTPGIPRGTKIAKGISRAFKRLRSMKTQLPSLKEEISALEFLKSQGKDIHIMVTGHSLGGCLSTVVPLWLRAELAGTGAIIQPLTIAGQTAGNEVFANYFQQVFPGYIRCYNTLDVVPMLWAHDSLADIKTLYPTPGPKCDEAWNVAIDIAMRVANNNYEQLGDGLPLEGKPYDEQGDFDFSREVSAQHSHKYYMYLSGIPLDTIHGTTGHPGLGPGWQPPGKGEE